MESTAENKKRTQLNRRVYRNLIENASSRCGIKPATNHTHTHSYAVCVFEFIQDVHIIPIIIIICNEIDVDG